MEWGAAPVSRIATNRLPAVVVGSPDAKSANTGPSSARTQGLCSRYVTEWAGPDALVRGIRTKLGGPNMPGDTLKLRGKVVSAEGGLAEVEVTGNNAWGNHVTTTFTLELPS